MECAPKAAILLCPCALPTKYSVIIIYNFNKNKIYYFLVDKLGYFNI